MKIAVFHNFLDNIGGAEIVALTLTRDLQADLYTTNIDAEKIKQMGYGDILEHIKSIGCIPKQAPFRQQAALYKFRHLNLKNQYDFFIIAGDWAMSAAVNNRPNLWYVHSPLNELWAFTDFIQDKLLSAWKKPIYKIWVKINRHLSLKYAKSVDIWVSNSLNTKKRIAKYYKKEAEIIYPPIDIKNYTIGEHGDYWLSVNRLAVHKRIELQLAAFKLLPEKKLIIIGSYEKGVKQFESYKRLIENSKTDNVTIKHWVSQKELLDLYANCRGFICSSQDEDFGMTAIEAMASGKAIIAPKEGGYVESIIDGMTGHLIAEISGQKIADKIQEVEKNIKQNPEHYRRASRDRAEKFSREIFISEIENLIKKNS